jgi:HEAT repeat protein
MDYRKVAFLHLDSSVGRGNLFSLQNTVFWREVNSFFSILTNISTLRHSLGVHTPKSGLISIFFCFLMIVNGCRTNHDNRFQETDSWDALASQVLDQEEVIKPGLTDVSYLLGMLNSDDVRHRHAAVILLNEMDEPGLYPMILEAINDPETEVREEVFRLAMKKEEAFASLSQRGLAGRDPELIKASLRFLRMRGKPEYKNDIRQMFSHEDSEIRRRAAYAYISLFSAEDQGLREALDDNNPLVRDTAIKALGFYPDKTFIPWVIRGFFDESKMVQDTAQFTIMTFGISALPSLVEALENGSVSVKLMVLQVFEGMQETATLDSVIPLIFSRDPKIRARSRMVVLSFRNEATAYISQALESRKDSVEAVLELLRLLEETGDPQAIPIFSQYLNHPDPGIVQVSRRALLSFGDKAFPVLRDVVSRGKPEERAEAVNLLLLLNDPYLLMNPDTGRIDHNQALLLIQMTEPDLLQQYLNSTKLNQYQIRDMMKLKQLQELADSWLILSESGLGNICFYYYLKWEQSLLKAARFNDEALLLNHEFLENGESALLAESRDKRESALILEEQADDYSYMAGSQNSSEREKGYGLIELFRKKRKEILGIEHGLSPELRPLAGILLESRGIVLIQLEESDWISRKKAF